MRPMPTVAAVAAVQLALVGVGVAPQLSARLTGESHLLLVAPLDPIDPFRGAYVQLDYPDLRPPARVTDGPGEHGDLYVVLEREGEGWVAAEWQRDRPEDGHYLACSDRDWQLRCGIESWFLPQDEALAMERDLADGAWAEVRIDGRGNAVLVDVREEP